MVEVLGDLVYIRLDLLQYVLRLQLSFLLATQIVMSPYDLDDVVTSKLSQHVHPLAYPG